MQQEIWLPVKGFEGYYEVSSFGRIKSLITNKILKPYKQRDGYLLIDFKLNKKRHVQTVHRVVALNFLHKIDGKNEVNHKDGNKSNNNLTNLEWSSRLENMRHSYEVLKRKNLSGAQHPLTYKFVSKKNGLRIKEYNSLIEAELDGFNKSAICMVLKRKRKHHRGFTFEKI